MYLPCGAKLINQLCLSIRSRVNKIMVRNVASPRMRSWLTRFPITRWLVHQETQRLFDLCAGFVYSQVLFAFIETKLLEALSVGPVHIEELTFATNLPLDRLERLLQATSAIGLTFSHGPKIYGLGLRGAALVDNPGVIAMVRHHALLYQDLADPLCLLRNPHLVTRTSAFWSYLAEDRDTAVTSDNANAYSDLMASSQTMISEIICSSINFKAYQKVLDVGGGKGVFGRHIAKSAPGTIVTVFDLPEVVDAISGDAKLSKNSRAVNTIRGDFFKDIIPSGYDLITLVRVLYDHSDDGALKILTNIHNALPPNGTLMIAEPFASARGTDRTADTYFNIYLLAMRAGNVRTFGQHAELLRAAGFRSINCARSVNPALARIILAQP